MLFIEKDLQYWKDLRCKPHKFITSSTQTQYLCNELSYAKCSVHSCNGMSQGSLEMQNKWFNHKHVNVQTCETTINLCRGLKEINQLICQPVCQVCSTVLWGLSHHQSRCRCRCLLSSSRSVMSRVSEGRMASNILKSFPNLGMSRGRQEGAWRETWRWQNKTRQNNTKQNINNSTSSTGLNSKGSDWSSNRKWEKSTNRLFSYLFPECTQTVTNSNKVI